MIEHFYEYLPAAWFTPEGCFWATLSVLFLMGVSFALGFRQAGKQDKSEVHVVTCIEQIIVISKSTLAVRENSEGLKRLLCTRGSHVTLFQYVVRASCLGRRLAFEENI